jgi:hypothetical protein
MKRTRGFILLYAGVLGIVVSLSGATRTETPQTRRDLEPERPVLRPVLGRIHRVPIPEAVAARRQTLLEPVAARQAVDRQHPGLALPAPGPRSLLGAARLGQVAAPTRHPDQPGKQ